MPKTITPKSLGAPLGMYSHGMVAPGGEIVVVAGQVGIAPDGRVATGDVGAQTRQALENVRAVVEAAGCTMRDVVRLQTFLTRAEDIPGFMTARTAVFPGWFAAGAYPPNTLLVVSRLVRPELLVEIEAMAVKSKGASTAPAQASPRKKQVRRPGRRSKRGRSQASA
ncbi:MAG: RidA family protein [Candidatus Rokuibacteriota bacterium]